MGSKRLDFVIIGAAKSGTTTLHYLLKQHPEIYIPEAKEVPFFNQKKLMKKGLDWYLGEFFKGAKKKQKWGTITPQYMYNREFSPKEIAENIKSLNPNVKLIVILRHPIKRAFSHYKSAVRRGKQIKFKKLVDKVVDGNTDSIRNKKWNPLTLSILGSEYGKILEPYYELFGRKKFLVLFMEDLERNPAETLQKIYAHLKITADFKAEGIGKKYNKGGMKPKMSFLTQKYLYRIPLLKKSWSTLVPYKTRKFLEVKIHSWNVKHDDLTIKKSSEEYKKLKKFYLPDVQLLSKITGLQLPWKEWKIK